MPMHSHERGIAVHGVDLSPEFIALAREATTDLPATFEVLDVRDLAFEAEFDAAICLCQGGFGLLGGTEDEAIIAKISRGDPARRGSRGQRVLARISPCTGSRTATSSTRPPA